MSRRPLDWLVPSAVVAGVVALLFSQTRRFGLLGFDTYPIILTSRVRSWSDFVGNFTERLMDGLYPGEFYRPLVNLSFALDHALWDLEPVGYHLTDALWLAAAALALWALMRRLLGRDAWFGPLAGLLVFLLSPLHWEVLPVPARRGDLMCLMFMALALTWQLAPRALAARRPSAWPAWMTLLAIAAKETGFVLPLLIALSVLLRSDRPSLRARLRHALIVSIPHLVATALLLAARLSILGGLGGHGTSAPPGPGAIARTARYVVEALLLPQPAMRAAAGYGLLALLTLAGGLALGVALRRTSDATGDRALRRSLQALALAAAWVLLPAATYAAGGTGVSWYSLIPLGGWAVATAAAFHGLLALSEEDAAPVRVIAMAGLILLTLVVAWQSSWSPVIRRYDAWERATRAGESYLEQVRAAVDAAPPGSIVETAPVPYAVGAGADGPTLRGAAVFSDYTVRAWAELSFPSRSVRVHYGTGRPPSPADDEIVLHVPGHAVVP